MIAVGDSTIRRRAKSRSSHATQSVINPVMEVLITEVPFYKPTYRYQYEPTPWILAIARRPLGCRTEEVISSRDSTRTLEQTRSGSSEDKAANMRQVCHAAGLHLCYSACVEELSEKPKTN